LQANGTVVLLIILVVIEHASPGAMWIWIRFWPPQTGTPGCRPMKMVERGVGLTPANSRGDPVTGLIDTDTVHRNARIYTLDPAQPWASVLLVRDGVLAAVGDDDLLGRVESEPEIVDHAGAFVMPGLGDVHNHHMLAGRADRFELQLDAAADLRGLLPAIRACRPAGRRLGRRRRLG
jgi:hypothetical protein